MYSTVCCVSLAAFPLQLLLRRHLEWVACPVAVIAEDRPQAPILWVNEAARRAGVLPGLRYAAGCSLAADLRAGVVPPIEIAKAVAAITERLRRFTPEVEPSTEEPGVLWLNATGLDHLYTSLEEWARVIAADLGDAGFRATVVVGFTRFGTYAVARAREGTVVFENPDQERAAAQRVQLDRLDLDPELRDTLSKLGVGTVGTMLSLPPEGLFERFGPDAYRLHRMAAGELWAPLQPCHTEEPILQALILDHPETDATRLLFLVKRLLHPLLAALAARGEALVVLTLRLLLDGRGSLEEHVCPAAPTLDAAQILDLVRLRLEMAALPASVVEVELTARGVRATREQLRLFAERPRRDLDAANRALARTRATFGDQAVVRARLTDEHLPEASFVWEPLGRVSLPRPRQVAVRSLVRRIFAKPIPLPPLRHTRDDGSSLLGGKHGAVEERSGPYISSGGWWVREVHREYYFAETRRGELFWIFYDPHRRQWFLQGTVE
jgi:protein ImuB